MTTELMTGLEELERADLARDEAGYRTAVSEAAGGGGPKGANLRQLRDLLQRMGKKSSAFAADVAHEQERRSIPEAVEAVARIKAGMKEIRVAMSEHEALATETRMKLDTDARELQGRLGNMQARLSEAARVVDGLKRRHPGAFQPPAGEVESTIQEIPT